MKNISFFTLMVLLMTAGMMTMQAQQFASLVAEGKQWNVVRTYVPWPPVSRVTDVYKLEGDTLVEGTNYKMLLTTQNENYTDWELCGLLRETNDGLVFHRNYSWNHTFGSETLLYDFSMQPGDSICYDEELVACLKLLSVNDTLLEGENTTRKKYVFRYEENGYPSSHGYETWIEGIGSEYGLLGPGSRFLMGDVTDLLCYYEDEDLVWQNPNFHSCYMVSQTVDTVGTMFLDEASSLYYIITSTNPLWVSVTGHIDGENAQGELDIPNTVTYDGVTYTVTEIAERAFKNCTGLTGQLTIPSTIGTIQGSAFYGCSGFTSVMLPYGLKEIREHAFAECTGFTGNLMFPETVTHIKYGAFHNCSGFSGDLVLPNSVVEVGHTNIQYIVPQPSFYTPTFADCFDHLVLSQSLDTIGMYCFAGCTQLTGDLVMPNSLKAINDCAFMGCTGFNSLTLNDSLSCIGKSAFGSCSGITGTLSIPENISIGPHAFEYCEGIEELALPHNITFAESELIKGYVFLGCKGLTEVDIPEGWTRLEQSTFAYCSNLRHVHLPDGLTSIEGSVFMECTNLEEINIPEGVTAIGASDFLRCRSLNHIELPSTLTVLGGAFGGCTGLTGEVVIPDLVQRINMGTFDSCYMIDRIVIGDAVNWIAEPAFKHTELSSIVLKPLTPPQLWRNESPNAWHFPADIPIIVPCGALEAYQNDENWGSFTNINEDCGSGMVSFNGSEWYYEIQNLNGSITYQHLQQSADTAVNDKTVTIIIRTNTLYDKGEHQEVTREYIYEEDNVVYWWNNDLQEFTVLYDLGAEQGDEWEIKVGMESIIMHVDAVDQYYYDGKLYKMLQVSDADDLFSGIIVCGIGHLTSFFPERLMTRGKAYRVEGMRCYWRDGQLVFKYGDRDCDEVYQEIHNGLDDPTGTQFSLYPNPTDGILFVQTLRATSLQTETYRISNLMGQTLMSGTITNDVQWIDVSNLPEGMYFITVGDATRKFVVR